MTNEETVKYIECIVGYENSVGFVYQPIKTEALVNSMDALKKQIPMGDDNTFDCPRCHKVEFGYLRPKYCDNCGQRIADWSDEDDIR